MIHRLQGLVPGHPGEAMLCLPHCLASAAKLSSDLDFLPHDSTESLQIHNFKIWNPEACVTAADQLEPNTGNACVKQILRLTWGIRGNGIAKTTLKRIGWNRKAQFQNLLQRYSD